ncbi:MAG: prolyl oligopeptidase family serine peptidase [Flavobacteriales bacterium]|nr:prolyl oligopeptidase family serine peptidase [Flavobacteriales bacterium]
MRNALYQRTLSLMLLAVCLLAGDLHAQWSTHTITVDGRVRSYRTYVPASYTGASAVPLVYTFHGLGDNMMAFGGIGMHQVADTAGFIVVVPQAVEDPLLTANAWNAGAGFIYYPNTDVDDVAFVDALLDTLEATYQIDDQRIYSCGFSLGGFMTQRLACERSDRFAAVASMAGTFGTGLPGCVPTRPVPVAHFHGTLDQTIEYNNGLWGVNVDSLIHFWVQWNSCADPPQHTPWPDNANDGFTIDHYAYGNGAAGSEVELFKVNGAGHQWLFQGSNDLGYSQEAWRFFLRHTLAGEVGFVPAEAITYLPIHPNPASNSFRLTLPGAAGQEGRLWILDPTGRMVHEERVVPGEREVHLGTGLASALYTVHVELGEARYRTTLVVHLPKW